MAKKKSKAASSARGYATTSVPSRATPVPKKAENNDTKKPSKVDAVKETSFAAPMNDPVNNALHETNSFDDLLTEETSPLMDTELEKLKSTALSTSKSFLHTWQTELRLRKNTNIMSFSDDESKLIFDSFRNSWIDSLKSSANQSNLMAYPSKKRLLWSTYLSLLDMGFNGDQILDAFSSLPIVSIEDYIAWIVTEPASLENPSSFNYEVQPTKYTVFCRQLDEPLPAVPVSTSGNKRLAPLMTKKEEPIEPSPIVPKPEPREQDEKDSKDGDAYSMTSLLQQIPEEEDMPGNDPYELTTQYVKVKMKLLRLQLMGQKDSDATDILRSELEGITSQYLFSSKEAESVLKRKRGEFMSKLKALQAKIANERAVKALQNQKSAEEEQATEENNTDSNDESDPDQVHNESAHEDQQSRIDEDTDLVGGLFNEPEESSVVVDNNQSNYTYLPLSMDRSGTRPSTTLQYELHKLGNNLHADYKTYPIGHLGWQSICFVKCPTGQKTFMDAETVLPSPVLASDYIATLVLFKLVSPYTKLSVTMFPKSFKDLFEKLSDEQLSAVKQEDMKISENLEVILKSKGHQNTGVQNKIGSKPIDTTQTKSTIHRPPEKIIEEWNRQLHSSNAEKFRDFRNQLPASQYKNEILEAVKNNQLLIVSGDTGCGKSTQIPAFLLEDALSQGEHARIYVTEPRRISAVSLAQRVSQELGAHSPSNRSHEMVGYSVRLDSKSTSFTPLVYVTTGVFLRLLEVGDEIESVTHLIIDEVHERSIDSDLLLIHVLHLLKEYPKLKVIVMSATLNAEKFQAYFNGSSLISIPGKTFPVQRYFLEDIMQQFHGDISLGENSAETIDENDEYDVEEGEGEDKDSPDSEAVVQNPIPKSYNEKVINYDLILFLLKYVFTEGNPKYSKCVLVFFPGISEILRMRSLIDDVPMFQKHKDFRIYILHSSLSSAQQQSVFEIPPRGCRKIVLSTNIAETGVTIPDVTCVIDTGVHREMRYNSKRHLSRLTDTFVSRANAKQRSGRAGRVQEGICYHLFSKYKHDTQFLSYQTPEMLRLNLQEVVLRVKVCQMGEVQDVLGNALDAPSSTNVGRALEKLQQLGAIGEFERLTKLGKYLAQLPLDASLGKLLVLGCFYKSVDAIVSIVAMITIGSPFRKPVGLEFAANKARLSFAKENTRSDLLLMYYAYYAWREVCLNKLGPSENEFCREKYLNVESLSMAESLKIQLLNELKDMNLISAPFIDTCKTAKRSICRRFAVVPKSFDLFSDNAEMVSAIIGASLYPNILKYDFEKKYWTSLHTNKRIRILDVSVNNKSEMHQMPSKIVAYTNMMSSTRASEYVAETTMVTIRMLLSLCGLRIDLRESIGQAKLDRFTVYLDSVYTASALHMLRSFIESSFTAFLSHPEVYLSDEDLAVIVSLVSRLNFNRVQKQKITA